MSRARAWIIFGLLVLCVALFQNTWQNPFVLDDLKKIVENPDLLRLDQIFSKLVYPYHGTFVIQRNDPSRPAVYLLYALAYHFGDGLPLLFHLLNTVVHWFNGVGVFLLADLIFKEVIFKEVIFKGVGLTSRMTSGVTSGMTSNRPIGESPPLVQGLLEPRVLGAAMAAAFFLVLPIQGGTVAYIYGLSDLLSSGFVLFALYFFARALRAQQVFHALRMSPVSPTSPQFRSSAAPPVFIPLLGCWICFVFALLSKQSTVVLPALLLLLDLSFFSRWKWSELKQRLPLHLGFWALSFSYLVFRWIYFGGLGDLEGERFLYSPGEYLSVQGLMLLKYIRLTWIPVGLSVDHFLKPQDFAWQTRALGWVMVALIVTGLAFLSRGKTPTARVIGFSVLFYGLCMFPTSSIFPTVDCFVERRVYLANFAWVLGLGAWVVSIILGVSVASGALGGSNRRRDTIAENGLAENRHMRHSARRQIVVSLAIGLALILLTAYSSMTYARNQVFSSPKQLWLESLNLYPNNIRALNNLGNIVMDETYEGHFDDATTYFEKALQVDPNWISALSNLGIIYSNYKFHGFNPQLALQYFHRAIEIAPDDFIARYNAAEIYAVMKRTSEAEALYLSVIQLNPTFAMAYRQLAALYHREKRLDESRKFLEKALEIDPQILEK